MFRDNSVVYTSFALVHVYIKKERWTNNVFLDTTSFQFRPVYRLVFMNVLITL